MEKTICDKCAAVYGKDELVPCRIKGTPGAVCEDCAKEIRELSSKPLTRWIVSDYRIVKP